jgi:hypothetical protein
MKDVHTFMDGSFQSYQASQTILRKTSTVSVRWIILITYTIVRSSYTTATSARLEKLIYDLLSQVYMRM